MNHGLILWLLGLVVGTAIATAVSLEVRAWMQRRNRRGG